MTQRQEDGNEKPSPGLMGSAARHLGDPSAFTCPQVPLLPRKAPLKTGDPWGTVEIPRAKSPAKADGVGEEELMNSLPRALTSFCPELKRAQTAFAGKHPLQVPTLPLGMCLEHVPADSPRAPGTSRWLVCCQPVLPDRP